MTVSVEVCAAAPLIVTEVGFRLHLGMSMTRINEVVTLQVKFTIPLNPFVPVTLITPVFPVLVPAVIVKAVVPPPAGAKPGGGVMLRSKVVTALSVSEVPVMVTVAGLEVVAAELLAVRVST